MGGHTADKCWAAYKADRTDRDLRIAREDDHYGKRLAEEKAAREDQEERQQRRAEEKAAYEERQQRRGEAAERRTAWLAAHSCWLCGKIGHTRAECPVGSAYVAKDADACSDISSSRSLASSAPSNATTAATAAALPKRVLDLPDKCAFCGTKRLQQTKCKPQVNLCKD